MQIKKKEIHKILTIFLFGHLIVWTLVPGISNSNLPLDTIEALAWGSNLDWGYTKHPPLSAFVVESFYRLFKNQDWAYYFLSQVFVVSSFFIVWKFSEEFFGNKIYSLLSLFLLEGIYFYNFTTPEFNVYVCQLPFRALAVYFCWRGFKNDDIINWLLFGLFSALGFLSHYLFIYLLIAIDIFFIIMILKKKMSFRCLASLVPFLLILMPHINWLIENDYTTITYALHRTGVEDQNFLDHLIHPFTFLAKQTVILIPFFVMFLVIISSFKIKINLKDQKLLYLLVINIVPIILVFLTSLFMGAKIRTMWMSPFYLFSGVLLIYIFQNKIILKKLKYFFSVFLVLFIASPFTYLFISVTESDKRTDYPGKEISKKVQEKWKNNFNNKITLVGGDEWHGGNLSYNLESRPKWDNILESNTTISSKNNEGGFILVGDVDILSKICSGVFFTFQDNKLNTHGICMVGKK